MAERSEAITAALIVLPNMFLFSFRIVSSELNEALSNDLFSELMAHSVAILIGILMAWRYRFIDDHEYRRSKTIKGLSRTYKLEDKGLWEKGDSAIHRLEARAYADYKGRSGKTAIQRMQSSIGAINREEIEVEASQDTQPYQINIEGLEDESDRSEKTEKGTLFSRIAGFFEKAVERSPSRRLDRQVRNESTTKKDEYEYPELENNSDWAIPKEAINRQKAKLCLQCSTYNDADTSYCYTCGSYIS